MQGEVSNHELAGAQECTAFQGVNSMALNAQGLSRFPSAFPSSNKALPIPSHPAASQQLKEFEFRATLRFMFKLGEPIPCIDAIVVALASDPKVHALGFRF